MAINQVANAVKRYEEVLREATAVYENTLRAAEAELRGSISQVQPEPPSEETVSMTKKDYDALQVQLAKVAKFLADHPELK